MASAVLIGPGVVYGRCYTLAHKAETARMHHDTHAINAWVFDHLLNQEPLIYDPIRMGDGIKALLRALDHRFELFAGR